MDEISPASLIKHDDRSESTLIGSRNCFLQRLLEASLLVLLVGLLVWDHYFGILRLFSRKLVLLVELPFIKYYNSLGAVDHFVLSLLLQGLFCCYFVRKDRDGEIKQTEDISHIEEGLFSDESVNTEFVNQVHDSAADSISHTTDFSPWERGDFIGEGGYGIVYRERNRITGDIRAVKELKNIENAESLRKEIKILCQLEHPNIVKYYGHEEEGHKISLYTEFIESGSLKKYMLKQGGALHETLIRKFAAQILAGLVYLHSERVIHRDLKPDNILVDSQDIVKLVDFGVSKHLVKSEGNHSRLGTLYYAAPEVLRKTKHNKFREASAADIWSLGCVIIEMLSGKHPWPDCEPMQAAFKVIRGKQPPIPEMLCQQGEDFLKLCFTRNPADRPFASTLLDHSFVNHLLQNY